MMITPRRTFVAIIGTLIVAALMVLIVPRRLPRPEVLRPGDVTVPEGTPTPTSLNPEEALAQDRVPATTAPSRVAVPPVPKKSYGEVVAELDTVGRRVQFSYNQQGTCQVYPSRFVTGSDTVIMFDNRSARKITVMLDGSQYPLPAFQYHIARIKFSRGRGDYPIHCGAQFNARTVMVQS